MPLTQALHILATIHTRDDPQTGCVVEFSVPQNVIKWQYSLAEYIAAWAAVREHLHMPTKPAAE